jgi:hypothetical protein
VKVEEKSSGTWNGILPTADEFEFARRLKGRIENGKIKRSGQVESPTYLVCESDAAENIRPSNRLRKKQHKMDGATAAIIAVGRRCGIRDRRSLSQCIRQQTVQCGCES